ncbi:DUF1707 domain-containing protein [Actinomadura barringtoniae]|uniref:DUF1707 domain-containing protein n=1 Tax=Actinomadura barringtoniae TaxID=1427535 RepID=A0A939TA85_9ACTN|nr:DUF1707 domain-containing protein [Actinomadura barringtoniae]MBO2448795.1 DUF1707 domain-containing protein [Actinomadura barringtoniae]
MSPDEIRIGDTERDAVTAALHDHFAEGRLTSSELDERLEATLTAKTTGDLRTIVRDLPGDSGLKPAHQPERGDHPLWGQHPYAAWQGPRHHMERRGHPVGPWGHHHLARGHRRGFPGFPIVLAVFLIVGFTAGFPTALFTVFQVALLIWIVKAIVLSARLRRSHHR